MSYNISFKAKLADCDAWVEVGECGANITWNLRDMIVKSTGLAWKNGNDNGLCNDVIPKIQRGLDELISNRDKYKKYEAKNGWGTVGGCIGFFQKILDDWKEFSEWTRKEIVDVTHFWIS